MSQRLPPPNCRTGPAPAPTGSDFPCLLRVKRPLTRRRQESRRAGRMARTA